MRLIANDGTEYVLRPTQMTVGRAPGNDILIADPRVSSRHGILQWDGSAFVLTDQGSTNGTFVNNVRLTGPCRLRPGAMVNLGGFVLTFQGDAPQVWPGGQRAPEPTLANPLPPVPAPGAIQPYPGYPPPPPSPYPPPYPGAGYGTKDRSLAIILELVPALFGIFGIGWMYAGNVAAGIIWLIGMIIWEVVAVLIVTLTGGFGCFCTAPVSLLLLAISVTSLSSYARNHPELFRP